jgi:hypothetical protein
MCLRTGYGATKAMETYGSNAWSQGLAALLRRRGLFRGAVGEGAGAEGVHEQVAAHR